MKTNKILFGTSCFAIILLGSCKKENNTPGVTYQLKAASTPSAIVSSLNPGDNSTTMSTLSGSSLQWTSGYASAVEIEFEAENNNAEVEYKSEARQKIDLFSPLSTLGVITVPPGTYDDIEFEVEVQPNGNESAFQLNGSFTNSNNVTTPVLLNVNNALEIESKQTNITIADGADLNALTTLNLSLITTGVTETMFNNAARTNGIIEISATSNADIYNIIYENLKNCGGVEIDD